MDPRISQAVAQPLTIWQGVRAGAGCGHKQTGPGLLHPSPAISAVASLFRGSILFPIMRAILNVRINRFNHQLTITFVSANIDEVRN
jgi:hypothetical protein